MVMASIHVLEKTGERSYRIVGHFNLPDGAGEVLEGNNGAGVNWKTLLLAAGELGSTSMTEGNGPGQISTAEKASVEAGDVVEVRGIIKVNANSQAEAIEAGQALRRDWLDRVTREYVQYGRTIG